MKSLARNVFLGTTVFTAGIVGVNGIPFGIQAHAQTPNAAVVATTSTSSSTAAADYQAHHIDVKGESIYYNANIKNPKFKTLIMVHGAGSQADSWAFVTPKLQGDFNYITLDLPGHYRSGGEARTSINDDADFINDFVKAIQKKYDLKNDFTYVGHSLGGAIGIELGTRHYDWLKSLVLVTTESDFTHAVSQQFLDDLKNGQLDLSFYQLGFSPSTPSVYYNALVSRLNLVSLEATYHDFYATSQFNDTDKLHKINKDTLIISADDDRIMTPNAAQVLHDGIEHNTWLKVPKAGHFIIMEQPSAVANAISSFVTK